MKRSEEYKAMGVPHVLIACIEASEEIKQEWREEEERLDILVMKEYKKLQEYKLSVEGQIAKIRKLNSLFDGFDKEKLLEMERDIRKVLWDLQKKFEYKIERARITLRKLEEQKNAQ